MHSSEVRNFRLRMPNSDILPRLPDLNWRARIEAQKMRLPCTNSVSVIPGSRCLFQRILISKCLPARCNKDTSLSALNRAVLWFNTADSGARHAKLVGQLLLFLAALAQLLFQRNQQCLSRHHGRSLIRRKAQVFKYVAAAYCHLFVHVILLSAGIAGAPSRGGQRPGSPGCRRGWCP